MFKDARILVVFTVKNINIIRKFTQLKSMMKCTRVHLVQEHQQEHSFGIQVWDSNIKILVPNFWGQSEKMFSLMQISFKMLFFLIF